MKLILGLLFFAIAISVSGNPNPSVDKSCVKYSITIDSKSVKEKVEKEMLATNGVTTVVVNVEDRYIEVSYTTSKVNSDDIKAKIEKLGLNPQPLKCKPQSSYCEGDCRNCPAIKSRGRH